MIFRLQKHRQGGRPPENDSIEFGLKWKSGFSTRVPSCGFIQVPPSVFTSASIHWTPWFPLESVFMCGLSGIATVGSSYNTVEASRSRPPSLDNKQISFFDGGRGVQDRDL